MPPPSPAPATIHTFDEVAPDRYGTVDACLNCGAARLGAYCHACGQYYLDGRLSLRQLWREFVARVLNVDRGLLHTFLDLSRSPGDTVRRYLHGQRRRYVSPFYYLFVGAALSVLTFRLIGAEFEAWTQGQKAQYAAFMTPGQIEAYMNILAGSMQYTAVVALFMCVPFGLLLRLFFRKRDVNLAESLVFALFTFGQVSFVASLFTLLLLPFTRSIGAHLWTSMGLYVLVCGVMTAGFYGRRIGVILKSELALAIAYGLVTTALAIAAMTYVSSSVRRSAARRLRSWSLRICSSSAIATLSGRLDEQAIRLV